MIHKLFCVAQVRDKKQLQSMLRVWTAKSAEAAKLWGGG